LDKSGDAGLAHRCISRSVALGGLSHNETCVYGQIALDLRTCLLERRPSASGTAATRSSMHRPSPHVGARPGPLKPTMSAAHARHSRETNTPRPPVMPSWHPLRPVSGR